ncbi:MAG TPA: hypothetical protein VK504_12740 [Vicinamibacterales bacterium]|nr:hypothetical protein [Vicinamibacterales bacterium]
MALNPKLANGQASRAADAVAARLNSGYLRIYDGAQPATADTAIGSQVLLAELRFNATAFGAAANGVAAANAITADSDANASGTAAWFRAFESDGTTVVFDGTVGTGTHDLVLNSTTVTLHGTVTVTSFSYTQQKS